MTDPDTTTDDDPTICPTCGRPLIDQPAATGRTDTIAAGAALVAPVPATEVDEGAPADEAGATGEPEPTAG